MPSAARNIADVNTLQTHWIDNEKISFPYSNLKLTWVGVQRNQITDLTGFRVTDKEPHMAEPELDETVWIPTGSTASFTIKHVGDWVDMDGDTHAIDMRLTMSNIHKAYLTFGDKSVTDNMPFLFKVGDFKDDGKRPSVTITATLTAQDGANVSNISGVTGFTDLDGPNSIVTGNNEAVELLNGFDSAWLYKNNHLKNYGTNGWIGSIDDNPNDQIIQGHGLKHYVGATFTGPTFTFRYSCANNDVRGSGLMPIDSTIMYPLVYQKNGGEGTVPAYK